MAGGLLFLSRYNSPRSLDHQCQCMTSSVYNKIIGILLFIGTLNAYGQTGAIATDRPDQSTTPQLIPTRALQLETGYSRTTNNTTPVKEVTTTYNNTLLKYGLLKNVELRLNASFVETLTGRQNTLKKNRWGPLGFGAKIKLADEKGMFPQVGLVATMNISVPSSLYQSGPSTELVLAFAHDFTHHSSLTYNVILLVSSTKSQSQAGYTFAYGYSLNESLGFFLECYGGFRRDIESEHFIDGGITFKLTPMLQLDCSGGISMISATTIYFFSTGVSLRMFK